jgi:hypothetical protein
LLYPAVAANSHWFDGLTLCVLGAIIYWLYRSARELAPPQRPLLVFASLTLVGFAFMLISKKSFTGYAVFFMYPALLVLVQSVRVSSILLLSFNVLMAIEPTVWFRLGGNGRSLQDWLPHASLPSAAIFMLIEAALLASYGYLAYLSSGSVRRTIAGAMASRNASQAATACSLV